MYTRYLGEVEAPVRIGTTIEKSQASNKRRPWGT